MDPEDISQRADRLSFVVAIMTKDYSRAIDMGTSILYRDPNDHHVRKCLSALKRLRKPSTLANCHVSCKLLLLIFNAYGKDKSMEEQENSLSNHETDVSTSGSEESNAAGSSSEDTDNEACDKIIETTVDAEKFCQARSSKSIADCVRESVSNSTGNTDKKLFNFREKMYRVLPLKFVRKK